MNPRPRLLSQLLVLVPTLATSFWLTHVGVAIGPRIAMSLGVGLIAIMAVSLWERGRK